MDETEFYRIKHTPSLTDEPENEPMILEKLRCDPILRATLIMAYEDRMEKHRRTGLKLVKFIQEQYKKPPRKIEIPMTNFDEALEGARMLYHEAIYTYNAYVRTCGVMLVQDLNATQKEGLEILLRRTVVMQDYFKNVLEAKRSFDPSGDE
ncbi:MAG TPA: hypothetical protein VI911_07570 [Patescibacteria group bacterium]|nr:hypothetical protein [Patescibacteria group bacterium]